MLRHLYSLVIYLLTPLVLLRVYYRALREPRYTETLAQRFGFVTPIDEPGLIWVHAVSAGETNAAAPLVKRLLAAGHKVLITTMTPTGRERVETLFGDKVYHAYAPYDLPFAVTRFIRRTRPVSLVIVDTELWPNMIWYARHAGLSVLLVNGRMSGQSARGYQRVSGLTRMMLQSFSMVAVQTDSHGARFKQLGLAPEKLIVAGSIKFDISHAQPDLKDHSDIIGARLGLRKILLAASTHEGEEGLILKAFKNLEAKDVLLVLAPRHSHRAFDVAHLCDSYGLKVTRHSEGIVCPADTRVYLLDTMGELLFFYSIAHIAIVGGSLVPVGGHNPMEPASLGVPVIMGPYQENLDEIGEMFRRAGGMLVCDSAESLTKAIDNLCISEELRTSLVTNARAVMDQNRGALETVTELVLSHSLQRHSS